MLAIGLCLVVVVAWSMLTGFFQKKATPVSNPNQTAGQTSGQGDGQVSGQAAPAAIPGTATTPPPVEEVRRIVEQPGLYRVEVTSRGAALTKFELLDSKMWSRDLRWLTLKNGQPVQEVRSQDGPTNLLTSYRPSLVVRLPESGVALPEPAEQQPYALVSDETLPDQTRRLSFVLELPEVKVVKTFSFPPKSLQIGFTVDIENKKNAPVSHHLEVSLEGYQDPSQKAGMFSPRVVQNEVLWDKAGKRHNLNLEALLEHKTDAEDLRGGLRWLGIAQQYFITGLAMPFGTQVGDKQAKAKADANGAISASVVFSDQLLQPGQKLSYPFTLYAGPKQPEALDAVTVSGQTVGMSTAIEYTWGLGAIARPLLWILRQFFHMTGSWAIAIVLLTLFVKLAMLWPSLKAMKSAKAMQELKPKMDALKLKYPRDDQRNEMNMAIMQLQRDHGVSPLGGCLPILLQMPIWVSLYSMLGNAVELYRVRLWWIADMTASDHYFVLPLLTGVLMFLQTKQSAKTTPVDPQMKMVTTMMPIMFTVFSIFLPAGLTLYILTNTVLGMVQQEIINRVNKTGAAKVAAAEPTVEVLDAPVKNPSAGKKSPGSKKK